MKVYQCKMCNAVLNVEENNNIVVCAYCGAQYDMQEEQEQDLLPSSEALLKRAAMFLEEGNFERANEYCEKVLDLDPECADAYLKKMMADLKVRKQEDLKDCAESFDDNINYKRFAQFAAPNAAAVLVSYLAFIKERNETQRKEKIYQKAVVNRRRAHASYQYRHVAEEFQSISGYKDADEQAQECMELSEKMHEQEVKIAQEEMSKKIAAEKTRKKICIICAAVIAVLVTCLILHKSVILPRQKLKEAKSSIAAGEYEHAYSLLCSIDIQNSKELLEGIQQKVYEKRLNQLAVGDVIRMGSYMQDKNSDLKSEIEWVVLDEVDGNYLLLSKYALEHQPYNSLNKSTDWKHSSLREWMHLWFVFDAFSEYEQSLIVPVRIVDGEENTYLFEDESDDMDLVFLLSSEEVSRYNILGKMDCAKVRIMSADSIRL